MPTRSLERSFAWALDVELVSGSLAVRYGDDDEMVIELERVSYREERAIELLDESLEPEDGAPPRLRRSFVSVTGKAVVRDLDDGTLHAEVSFR